MIWKEGKKDRKRHLPGRIGFEPNVGVATLDMRLVEVSLTPQLIAEKIVSKLGDGLFGPVRVGVLSRDADGVPGGSQVLFQLVGYFLASHGIKTKTL